MLQITEMRVDDLKTNIVTDCTQPLFSFALSSDRQNTVIRQTRFQVRLQDKKGWDSGVREDGETNQIRYEGERLLPFSSYELSVWAKDSNEETAEGKICFETGMLQGKWKAKWITDSSYHFFVLSPKPMTFRKSFPIQKKVKSARVYSTALGIYELNLNGGKVGNDYFAPGYTSYQADGSVNRSLQFHSEKKD